MSIFLGDWKCPYDRNSQYVFTAVSSVHSGDGGQMFEPSANLSPFQVVSRWLWWTVGVFVMGKLEFEICLGAKIFHMGQTSSI